MQDSLTDEELMRQVAGGDLDRMSLLFQRYQTPLYQFFRRLGQSPSESEDLVQDVFFRILRSRHTYRADAPFRAWIYQIARNIRVDYLRRSMRESPIAEEFGDTVDPGEGAHRELERADNARVLRDALAALPERKRELIVLSKFHGMKYREIADMMGCDLSTVKVRAHRCVQELRQIVLALSERRTG